ncbi:hypothetical protein [Alkalihalobacillus sp. AL-G]|uniref:hypothetical protein n=1 Tax=Alkalihalobacillus sp. AL-G TaxID=2926399 RepID=UPI00272CCDE1|nr:hypothetical protein [Alkalihalobacillus sp. AL-G]WLD94884.1 hypothetical protein MOJ78_08380 [Alkalihalobacillus sp. AL-G]
MKLKSKKVVMSSIAASVTGVATYYLRDESNRIKLKDSVSDLSKKIKDTTAMMKRKEELPVEKGGQPNPQDIEDNKMVSEGAQYSVEYYNKEKQ